MKDNKNKLKMVLLIGAFFLCGVLYFSLNAGSKKEAVVTESFADQSGETKGKKETSDSKTEAVVYIYICGEVKNPGVYTFAKEPHFIDVVEKAGGFTQKAGGFTQKADKLSVNLAEVVKDGTQLTIEKKRKRKAAQEEQSSHGMSSADEAGKINLNTASAEQLMKLSGIGESKAAQIISYREKNGAFKKIEDIMNITGIKEGVFGKIKDDITV